MAGVLDDVHGMSANSHFGSLAKDTFGDIVPAVKDWGVSKLKDAGAWVKDQASDVMGDVAGRVHSAWDAATGLFDTGGVLEPGEFAYNASRKPEAVFNHRQFREFAESAGGANRARRTEFVITNWDKGSGYFREIADDAINGDRAYRGSIQRMGRHG